MHAPWLRVLNMLGVPVSISALPVVTVCPLCSKNRLILRDDYLCGGQWFVCGACHQFGDMIELASKVWKLATPATIAKLTHHGFQFAADEAAVQGHIREHVERRGDALALWKASRRHLLDGSTVSAKLIHELGFTCSVPASRWKEGPGKLFGSQNRRIVDKALRSDFNRTLFPGGKWEDVVVIPFFDLPRRICGFYFVGREGDEHADTIYHREPLQPADHIDPWGYEAGLAMHPAAISAARDWNNTVLALSDPTLMIALQTRNFEQSTRALPVVAWYKKPDTARGIKICTRHGWQLLDQHHPVLWMPKFDHRTVQQAIEIGGSLYIAGPRDTSLESLRRYMRQLPPRDFVAKAMREAQPWPRVLARHAATLTTEQLEGLCLDFEAVGFPLAKFIDRCPTKLQQRLDSLIAEQRKIRRTTNVGGMGVTEQDGQWHVTRASRSRDTYNTAISNAALRIEEVIWHKRADCAYFRGHVLFAGKAYPFCEPESVIQENPFRWMDDLLRRGGAGGFCYVARFNRYVVYLAKAFHKPSFTSAVDVVGWSADKSQFVFPNFLLRAGGEVIDAPPLPFMESPCQSLPPPEMLSSIDFSPTTGDRYQGTLLWACVAAIAANILAPSRLRATCGIGLYGQGATLIGHAVAGALGCLSFSLQTRDDQRRLAEQEHRHNWPVAVTVTSTTTTKTWRKWLDQSLQPRHNAIASLNWWQSRARALMGGWTIISSDLPFEMSAEILESLPRLLVAYLKDLMCRGFKLAEQETWFDMVLADMADFADRHDADGDVIVAAADLVEPDSLQGNPGAFVQLTGQLVYERQLMFAETGFEHADKPCVSREQNGLYFRHDDLRTCLRRHNVVLTDYLRITSVLKQAGVLIEARPTGWLVDELWWTKNYRRHRGQESGFRVVG